MGARIVQVARDPERGEAALTRLNENGTSLKHSIHYADLSLVTEMRRVAADIAAHEPRIDVLINNAGAMFSSRNVTQEGLEYTFALNHLSYFVLTQGLRERLIASAPARIVNTASDSHEAVTLDFKDPRPSARLHEHPPESNASKRLWPSPKKNIQEAPASYLTECPRRRGELRSRAAARANSLPSVRGSYTSA